MPASQPCDGGSSKALLHLNTMSANMGAWSSKVVLTLYNLQGIPISDDLLAPPAKRMCNGHRETKAHRVAARHS